jgi:16S rRNA (adenine1518-N6/adenine1519-N6)-dimethyltransferase
MRFDKRKAFGQHFLVNAKVIEGIVASALQGVKEHPSATLLEIGPGDGALTLELVKRLPPETEFFVSEVDRDLIAHWSRQPRIQKLIEGDFVQQADATIDLRETFVIVSNLPYSAGTAILSRLIEYPAKIRQMTLMFQKEVADRIAAREGSGNRGSLSVDVQNRFFVERILIVPPAAFRPPPKVHSAVVVLKPREQLQINVKNREKDWTELLRLAFGQRRKTIKNALSMSQPWSEALLQSGVPLSSRAQELDFEGWRSIWSARFP